MEQEKNTLQEELETAETVTEQPAEEVVEEVTEAVAEEIAQPTASKPQKAPKGSGERLKRRGATTLMAVIFIAIVVVINVIVGALTDRFPSLNIDLTAEKLNTLSDQALEIAKGVEQETNIYLIGTEDEYLQNRYGSSYSQYGLDYSKVPVLAEKLEEASSYIHTSYVDPDSDPKFISDHAEYELTSGCVLVETASRGRVLDISDLFALRTNSTTYQTEAVSQIDSALAGALEQVNMDKVPVICIATGHNEMLSSSTLSAFTSMMEGQNFELREIDFLTEEIPEETEILMIPTPQSDYTTEEIEKLHDYLDDDTTEQHRTILVTFHTTQEKLPKLEAFLEEWGFSIGEGMVAETDSSRMMASYPSFMLVNANQEKILTDETYANLVVRESRPIDVLFDYNNNVAAYPLWETADSAYVYVDESSAENPATESQTVAAMADTYAVIDKENWLRSVVVFGNSYVFTDSYINATAYGDGSYIRDLLQYTTGTDASQVTVKTQQVQTRVLDISASQSMIIILGLGVFTIGIPLLIIIIGLAVFLKRRHL